MPFLLLLVLTLVCLQHDWPRPPEWLGAWGGGAASWSLVLLSLAVAGYCTRRLKRVAHAESQPAVLLKRYTRYRQYLLAGQLAVFFVALGFLGWGWTARVLWTAAGVPLPGVEIVVLAPLLASMTLAWSRNFDVELALHGLSSAADAEPFPGRWSYVGTQVRHNLILILPPLFLLIIQQSVLWAVPSLQHDKMLLPMFGVGLLVVVFVAIPWLLRLLLGLRPLPPGPLRERLTATANRLSFRFSDILVWSTRNSVANAMVTGPMPFLRYVVLTDRLLSELTPDEIEAVFGHEIGHVKHRHMLFYFGFLLASLLIATVLWNSATRLVEPLAAEHWLVGFATQLVLVMLLGAYIFVVFGFVSRRCERQADVFGCRITSCQTFVDALEKVARLNGIHRERPGWLSSWQHSTIARRVAFLERMSADPAVEPCFQRRVGYVKLGALLALGTALVVLALLFGPEHVWASLNLSRVEAPAAALE